MTPYPYQPISCELYDYIEIAAMRRSEVVIEYVEEGKLQKLTTKILDTVTNEQAEYIKIAAENKLIRMDQISTLDGRQISFTCQLPKHK